MPDGDSDEGEQQPARPRLFLSYTRADIEQASPIIAILEEAGFDVWWDGLIEGGDHYLPTTEAALEGADCVVVLWSARAVDSSWVRDEAQSGRERGRLVPVSLDGTMSPLGFRQIQLIDFSGWNGKPDAAEVPRMLSAIERVIASDGGSGQTTLRPSAYEPPPRVAGPGLSRRALVIGGIGTGIAAAGFGAWKLDLLRGAKVESVIAMAVLGFANLTGKDDQAWFSNRLSNELRQMLARNPLLRVSAPTSSAVGEGEDDFSIGRALGVPYILRGSVQRNAEVVRINVELVEVKDGVVRWGETFDREFADVFAVQTEIARTVAIRLVAQIASESEAANSIKDQQGVGGTKDIAAYEAYLRGLALAQTSAGVDTDSAALTQFEIAIDKDPGFARAHAMRANMLAAAAGVGSDPAQIARTYDASIAAARRSIALAPGLADGHLALGYALFYGKLDLKAAAPHYARGLELAPGDADVQRAVAMYYAYADRGKEAQELLDKSLALDPLNPRAFRTAGFVALMAGDLRRTVTVSEKALALNPNLARVHSLIGTARLLEGDLPAAAKSFDAEPVAMDKLVGQAIVRAKQGRQAEAQAALDDLIEEFGDGGLYQQAMVRAQWGETAEALALLERAYEIRDPGLLFLPTDALLDPLRNEPEFKRLLTALAG